MPEKKKEDLKADRKDTTAEERELARSDTGNRTRAVPRELSAEAAEARRAQARVDAQDAAAKQTGVPEVPGADTATHGGSGQPPTVDPDVQALIDSGVPTEVGGDNKLREVKIDKRD